MKRIHGEVVDGVGTYCYESTNSARCPKCHAWIASELDAAVAMLPPGTHNRALTCWKCKAQIVVEATVTVTHRTKVYVNREDLP